MAPRGPSGAVAACSSCSSVFTALPFVKFFESQPIRHTFKQFGALYIGVTLGHMREGSIQFCVSYSSYGKECAGLCDPFRAKPEIQSHEFKLKGAGSQIDPRRSRGQRSVRPGVCRGIKTQNTGHELQRIAKFEPPNFHHEGETITGSRVALVTKPTPEAVPIIKAKSVTTATKWTGTVFSRVAWHLDI